jgi:O-antigen/teichoic acid export membrane protein
MPSADRLRRLSKEGFWVILGQAVGVVGSLLSVRVLTELLAPAAYGQLALGMTVATLVSQCVIGPLNNGIMRFYAPSQEKGDLRGYLKAVRRLMLFATGVVLLLIPLEIAGLLILRRTEWIALATIALLFAILTGYNSVLSSMQNAARQRSIVALHQGMETWLQFLIAAGLMVWLGATSTVAMAGYGVAILPVLGSQYLFFHNLVPKTTTDVDSGRNWQNEIWQYSWPFTSFGLFTWGQMASDRWALELFASVQNVGRYAVLYRLGFYPITLITALAVQLLAPIFFQRAGDGSDSRRNANVSSLGWRLTWLALGVTAIAFFTTLLFHAWIFRILVSKEYASMSYLLPWMLFAGGIYAAGQTLALNLMSQMKTQVMASAKIVTALIGILLNFAGAYWFGIPGIVVAGILFAVLYFIWIAILTGNMKTKTFSSEVAM